MFLEGLMELSLGDGRLFEVHESLPGPELACVYDAPASGTIRAQSTGIPPLALRTKIGSQKDQMAKYVGLRLVFVIATSIGRRQMRHQLPTRMMQ